MFYWTTEQDPAKENRHQGEKGQGAERGKKTVKENSKGRARVDRPKMPLKIKYGHVHFSLHVTACPCPDMPMTHVLREERKRGPGRQRVVIQHIQVGSAPPRRNSSSCV